MGKSRRGDIFECRKIKESSPRVFLAANASQDADGVGASQKCKTADGGNGSEPVIRRCRLNVRIAPESGRRAEIGGCLTSARNGLMRRSKQHLYFRSPSRWW